jgi:GH43 family beta-xylosidase
MLNALELPGCRFFDVGLFNARDLNNLDKTTPKRVWCMDIRNVQCNMWAPELHNVNGHWCAPPRCL